ncbi:NAD(P)-dependent oxidoreductase [Nocardia alni]|uniref:NAD(P)-dependent oxidoreductase n=1 Tax=Nocardia alni TaxID=2815723 RepID=UPI001C22B3B1|nr:NAD(P)-dependent oxidoreductase [Nocardia alni]
MGHTIGFPRESAPSERRTLLTPQVAAALTAAGFEVLAEPEIGAGVFVSDTELSSAGVHFTDPETVWSAGLVLRYKSPDPADLRRLQPGQAIGALFHAEGDPRLLAALTETGVSAYSYEFLCQNGSFPLAVAGGQIAGVQAVMHGALALQSHLGGRGVLIGAVEGAPAGRVVVIGSGNVGAAAAATAAALGAEVIVLAHTHASAADYRHQAPAGARVLVNTDTARTAALEQADLVIGAILISTYDTPPMITASDLTRMKPGAVIVDATCGYGPGYLPTAGAIQAPGDLPFVENGIGHLRLDALPALVPVTTTAAYTARISDYLVRLARVALDGADDSVIDTARIATGGRLVHTVCQQHAAHYTEHAAGQPESSAAVVASYDQRAAFSRAETACASRPVSLAALLTECRHVVELPCGSGYFLSDYAAADVAVTVVDANAAMLTEAVEHARGAGIPDTRLTVLHGLLEQVRLPGDVDLLVVPNAALNQLACQYPLTELATILHGLARDDVGTELVAQILTTTAGECGASSAFDPGLPDGQWVTDRRFEPEHAGGALERRRCQSRHGNRVRVDLVYLADHGRQVHSASVALELFTPSGVLAAFTAAGFVSVRLESGAGGLAELRAVTGSRA